GGDNGGKEAAVVHSRQGVGEGGLLELADRLRQLGAALVDRLLQPPAVRLQGVGTEADGGDHRQGEEQQGAAARPPALPPGGKDGKGEDGGARARRASGEARRSEERRVGKEC